MSVYYAAGYFRGTSRSHHATLGYAALVGLSRGLLAQFQALIRVFLTEDQIPSTPIKTAIYSDFLPADDNGFQRSAPLIYTPRKW